MVGSKSLLNEVELASIYHRVFEQLKMPVEIRINNRKILAALAEICGGAEKMVPITIAIDKLDKIGIDKVKEELAQHDLKADQIQIIEQYLSIAGTDDEKISQLNSLIGHIDMGKEGIAEINFLRNYLPELSAGQILKTDFTLARGLNYYTGIIFEVKALNVQMGSIGGGGRYDDLTGLFDVPGVPGVGISFGVDRIYDVMDELNVFPDAVQTGTQVLFFNLGDAEAKTAFHLMQSLRDKGIACELFHENAKFDKQFKYADKKQMAFVVIIGSEELQSGMCKIKNLQSGDQQLVQQSAITSFPFL